MRRQKIKGIVHPKVFTNENDILKTAIVGKKKNYGSQWLPGLNWERHTRFGTI